ncbi:MAG: phosphoribosyltransferase family protein [Saprospiraceae bacterium]
MKLLDDRQIKQKIKRLAIQILERNFGSPEIILAGLNNNGLVFAELLLEQLNQLRIDDTRITLTNIRLNPANPIEYAPELALPLESVKGKPVIVVDDVANTGRTAFYAISPFLKVLPAKVEVAVLVDRTHKSFPIKADYVGLALATTMKDNIRVEIRNKEDMAVYLE